MTEFHLKAAFALPSAPELERYLSNEQLSKTTLLLNSFFGSTNKVNRPFIGWEKPLTKSKLSEPF